MKLNIVLIVGAILAFGGTLFSVIAYKSWRSTAEIVKNGIQTEGMVIDYRNRPRKVGERSRSTAKAPVVQFFTANNKMLTYYSQLYTTPKRYKIGEKVSIWYLPNQPNRATLEGADGWILPVAFGVFGFIMCVIGYRLLWDFVFGKSVRNIP